MTALERPPARSALSLLRFALSLPVVVLTLAVAAVVPGVNLLALGYLLEVQGRLGRGQRLREAFPAARFAPGFARSVALSWLWLMPLRVVSGLAEDAAWIEPGGGAAQVFSLLRLVLSALVGLHVGFALLRGGTFGAFLRPLKNLAWGVRWVFGRAGEAPLSSVLQDAVTELRPLTLLLDGARAALAALVWLAVPVGLMWLSRVGPARPGIGLLGALLLVPVLFVLPFTQARFATTGRASALFDWRGARAVWRRAPLAAFFAHLGLAALSMPLYLLTVVIAPRDAQWPAALVFIAALLPARALIAVALRRADRRAVDAPRWLRFSLAPLAVALLLVWAGLLLLTPAIDHRGALGLWAPHAFVLPAPF